MNVYEFTTNLVKNIIDSIESSAVAGVNSLKAHTFPSRITNFPKTQTIKGTVTVGNQKRLEKNVKDVKSVLSDIKKFLASYKSPDSIKVSNFPDQKEYPKFPDSFKVSNFPKQIAPPDSITVKNLSEVVKGLSKELSKIEAVIKKLKLAPVINVEAPKSEKVVVPPANVVLNEKEIDYELLAEAVASSMPQMDYTKLADAIGKKVASMVVTVGGGGKSGKTSFRTIDGKPKDALVDSSGRLVVIQSSADNVPGYSVNDTEDAGSSITYVGQENEAGLWYIKKIDESTSNTTIGHANVSNNKAYTSYEDAWDNRATLSYGNFGDIW